MRARTSSSSSMITTEVGTNSPFIPSTVPAVPAPQSYQAPRKQLWCRCASAYHPAVVSHRWWFGRYLSPAELQATGRGRISVNVEPWPGALVQVICPPWFSTMAFVMARPSPIPGMPD